MNRSRVAALAVVVFLLAAWIGFRLTEPPPDPVAARTWKLGAKAPLPTPPRRPARPAPPAPPEAAAPAAVPADPNAPAPSPEPDDPGEAAADAPPTVPLLDRREGDHPDAKEMMAELQSRLDVARADIDRCVREWTTLDPGIAGEVNLGFQLDADGLTEVWVLDQTEVPFGPRTCFGSAIAAIDWAGISAEPVEVTLNFDVGGETPGE